jgi:hypothetical protein
MDLVCNSTTLNLDCGDILKLQQNVFGLCVFSMYAYIVNIILLLVVVLV